MLALFCGWMLAALPAVASGLATTTTLTVSSAGAPVTTVVSGNVVTLTAVVHAGATAVQVGQVNFCDATAKYCTDVHVLGTAQLTSAGLATVRFRPAIGSHSIKAVFVGTGSATGSVSSATALSVTPTTSAYPTATSIAQSGINGNFTLTASVAGYVHSSGAGSPGGTVSFIDTSDGNAQLANTALGSGVYGENFVNSQNPAAGKTPSACAVGDFNGDGILDLVVSNDGDNTLSIFLGNGDGTFTAAANSPVFAGYAPESVTVSDFNGDGIQDLAVTNIAGNTVTVLLGNGDGTFSRLTNSQFPVGAFAFDTAVGDFNGDGIPDLVTANFGDNTLTILLGKGDGTFVQAPGSPITAGSGPATPVVGDFNGDGIQDLAVTNGGEGTLMVLLGSGDGTFRQAPGSPIKTDIDSIALVTADLNGDGKLDLALEIDGITTILLGKGDGSFAAAKSNPINAGNFPYSASVGDFNADGIPDLVFVDQGGDTATILLGKGDGTFTAAASSPLPVGNLPYAAAVGDFNGDGTSDMAVVNALSDSVTVLLSRFTETATATVGGITPAGSGTHNVIASYSGAGNFAASTSGPAPLVIFPPLATTTTALTLIAGNVPVTTVPAGTPVTLTATVQTGTAAVTQGQVNFCDVSGKSCTDIYLLGTQQLTSAGTAAMTFVPGAGSHSYKAIFMKVNDGTANDAASASNNATLTVTAPTTATGPFPTAIDLWSIGDVGNYSVYANVMGYNNSPGASSPTGTVSFIDTTEGNAVLATAPLSGNYLSPGFMSVMKPVPESPNFVATGDFNGDGIPDIAVLGYRENSNHNPIGNAATIMLGKGDGTFTQAPNSSSVGSLPLNAAVGDLNGDGISDLVVVNEYDDTVSILLGKGDGQFTEAPNSPMLVGASPTYSALGDFNGDGILDLAVSSGESNTVWILLGKGDGTFVPAQNSPVAVGIQPWAIMVADFNGDGIADLAVVNYVGDPEDGTVTILLGNGNGTFTQAKNSPIKVGLDPYYGVVGDFNRDGIPDIAVGNYWDGTISILLGKGDGTFKQAPKSPFYANGCAWILAMGDFNGDGIPDIAGLSYQGIVTVLMGKGDGTFVVSGSNAFPTRYPNSIAAADFNGDGLSDLAIANIVDNAVTVALTYPFTETSFTVTLPVALPQLGTHKVEARYSGSSIFNPSTSTTIDLTGHPVPTPAITWGTPAAITYGTALSHTQLNATSPVAGTFSYFPPAGTVLGAGTQTLSTTFTPKNAAAYTTATASVQLVVKQASPKVTWPTPAAIPYGAVLGATQLDANASVPGSFVYNPPAGTVPAGGSQTLTANFTPTDAVDYASVPAAVTLKVNKAAQTIRFTSLPTSVTYGASPFTLSATSSSGLAVTFTATGPASVSGATLTITGAGTVVVTANQAGNSNYNAAAGASQTVKVAKAVLTVTAASASVAYNQPLPKLTFSVGGFVNGDGVSVVTGAPTETTTAKQGSAVGSYPITLAQGTLAAANYGFSLVNGTVAITALGTTAAPSFTPAAGTYTSAQTVTLTSTTSGAVIYYTTNGSTPSTSSTKYAAPGIKVTATETVNAIAVAPGYAQSGVATAAYVIATAPVVITSAAANLSSSGATLNGTVNPENSTTQYWFAYGTSKTALSSTTAAATGLTGATAIPVTAVLTGLNTKTTYYFQVVAQNAVGKTPGSVLSFTAK